jgi:hypothetical protein
VLHSFSKIILNSWHLSAKVYKSSNADHEEVIDDTYIRVKNYCSKRSTRAEVYSKANDLLPMEEGGGSKSLKQALYVGGPLLSVMNTIIDLCSCRLNHRSWLPPYSVNL